MFHLCGAQFGSRIPSLRPNIYERVPHDNVTQLKSTNDAVLKGILWQKYKSGLKVVVFIDEIDGETHFAQLGSSWPGEPKMSRK